MTRISTPAIIAKLSKKHRCCLLSLKTLWKRLRHHFHITIYNRLIISTHYNSWAWCTATHWKTYAQSNANTTDFQLECLGHACVLYQFHAQLVALCIAFNTKNYNVIFQITFSRRFQLQGYNKTCRRGDVKIWIVCSRPCTSLIRNIKNHSYWLFGGGGVKQNLINVCLPPNRSNAPPGLVV